MWVDGDKKSFWLLSSMLTNMMRWFYIWFFNVVKFFSIGLKKSLMMGLGVYHFWKGSKYVSNFVEKPRNIMLCFNGFCEVNSSPYLCKLVKIVWAWGLGVGYHTENGVSPYFDVLHKDHPLGKRGLRRWGTLTLRILQKFEWTH